MRKPRRIGEPEVRESGWLYPPGRNTLPLAFVRLEDVVREDTWRITVYSPPSQPASDVYETADEDQAKAVLDDIYQQGLVHGTWTWRVHPSSWDNRRRALIDNGPEPEPDT
jgi:hypothetical protein